MNHPSHTRTLKLLTSAAYFFSIFIFINAFDLAHNSRSGWESQFVPDSLLTLEIADVDFIDSVNGFCSMKLGYVLRTTDAGFSWQTVLSHPAVLYESCFLNSQTGFVLSNNSMLKTVNQGNTWSIINFPQDLFSEDFHVLNSDSIWATDREALTGGIFLTTNGGGSWTRKYYAGGFSNPEKIYFANSRLGFASRATNNYLRTSDGGETWQIINGPFISFTDMKFVDSLTGFKAFGFVTKTTDGGLNWAQLNLPALNDTITNNGVVRISDVHKGSIYGVGPEAFVGSLRRKGLIFKTTDSGQTWGYQLPDTNLIKFRKYSFVSFIDKNKGWSYQTITGGIFTRTGGDSTVYVDIKNVTGASPSNYKLHQNYPNPFNPKTKIKFEVKNKAQIDISVYDVSGRLLAELVSSELRSGTYETEFDGSALSSGIYFCVMQSGSFRETITMALVK